ncbi:hypothetical protein JHK82_039832 [Glycine max]|nr:hypothetical protein JHK86_040028 [Glycine max]KAG4965627.1 hypothetical protein JHK85_040602 [Glycine max]KAG5110609.1 hypothetical protein JHK82_039832 [Glycine max]KAG5121899.1 hypothetical protein JHK84_040239 [Glycine max]
MSTSSCSSNVGPSNLLGCTTVHQFEAAFRIDKNIIEVPLSHHRQWRPHYPSYVLFDYNRDKHFIRLRKYGNRYFFADALKEFRRAHSIYEGCYVVLVAYMSVTPLLEDPILQDYLQPVVTSVDSVLEKDHDVDKMQEKAHNYEKEQTQPQESTCPPSTVDLTKDDDGLDSVGSWDIVERKPTSTSIHSQSDTQTIGNSELPILPDTVSPAFSQQFVGCDNNLVVNSAMHNQFSRPNNLQM